MGATPVAEPAVSEPRSRRERKKERTRREIYDAAMALFRGRGFDGVTVDAICTAADVARGTFFHHFPTKAALLYEFSNRVAEDFSAQPSRPASDAVAELRALVGFMIERLVAHSDVMHAMIREFFASVHALAAAQERGRSFPDLMEGIVRRGQESGCFRPGVDPRLASAMLLSTAGAILSGNVFRDDELDVEAIRDQYFDLVFHGLMETS
ncbi:MAG: hypothetical protein CL910_12720 [Deltaproteobacteria bacterium]|jgi:AcrR family transcriptional regulator|nr:hypothetical protein [Deltaproteobacteria bacterium]